MGNSGIRERTKVREVIAVFRSRAAALPAVDDLLLSGFDRADIDMTAAGKPLRNRIGGTPATVVELADIIDAQRQASIAPEEIAAIFAVCVTIMGWLGAMVGVIWAVASDATTIPAVMRVAAGATVGSALGRLVARLFERRRIPVDSAPVANDGFVIRAHVRTLEQEHEAIRILLLRAADAVRVRESEIVRRAQATPLSGLQPGSVARR